MPDQLKTTFRGYLAEARHMRWLHLAALATLIPFLAFAFPMLYAGADGFRAAHVDGIKGTFAVTDCRPHVGKGGVERGWDCVGTFTAQDNSLVAEGLEYGVPLNDRPTTPLSAIIGGPGEMIAYPADWPWIESLGIGVLVVIVGLYFTSLWYKPNTPWAKKRASKSASGGGHTAAP